MLLFQLYVTDIVLTGCLISWLSLYFNMVAEIQLVPFGKNDGL